jgi:hypothetical protein
MGELSAVQPLPDTQSHIPPDNPPDNPYDIKSYTPINTQSGTPLALLTRLLRGVLRAALSLQAVAVVSLIMGSMAVVDQFVAVRDRQADLRCDGLALVERRLGSPLSAVAALVRQRLTTRWSGHERCAQPPDRFPPPPPQAPPTP